MGSILGSGRFPRKRAWQSTPVFLPGEFPWTEEPGRLQSIESQRVGLTEAQILNQNSAKPFLLQKRKATQSGILAWRIPWTAWSTGSQRVGHD